jgi:hypothetical protein
LAGCSTAVFGHEKGRCVTKTHASLGLIRLTWPIFLEFLLFMMMGTAEDEWTRGIIFWFRWRSRAWENKSLVAPEAREQPAAAFSG